MKTEAASQYILASSLNGARKCALDFKTTSKEFGEENAAGSVFMQGLFIGMGLCLHMIDKLGLTTEDVRAALEAASGEINSAKGNQLN